MTLKGFMEAKRSEAIDSVVKSTLSEFEQKLCDTHMTGKNSWKKREKSTCIAYRGNEGKCYTFDCNEEINDDY